MLQRFVLTFLLQCCFTNNIETPLGRFLMDVVFPTSLQRHDNMDGRRNVKTSTMQHGYNLVCLLGYVKRIENHKKS